jgi:hypothetical protein
MFWRNPAAHCRGPGRGNGIEIKEIVALPVSIGVAAVSADNEIAIAFRDAFFVTPFGILRLLYGGAGCCHLLNGLRRGRQRRRALAGYGAETGGKS